MGRNSKLTDTRRQQICALIAKGNTVETSAQASGICKATLYNWINKAETNKDEDKIYINFLNAIKKATALAETRNIGIIQEAAIKNWQAAAWWLERHNPDAWGRKEKQYVEHSGKITFEQFRELFKKSDKTA